MDMTYQLMDQITAASTTGQTGAKRDAGTQNESDGGFETMVRQKTADRAGAADKTAAQSAEKPAPEKSGEDDRLALAAALLLQPQPEIVYVEDAAPAAEAETALPALEPDAGLLSAQRADAAPELPEQTPEAPETARFAQPLTAQPQEKPAEPVQAQPVAAPEQPDAELPRVELNGGSEGAALSQDAPETGKDETGNRIENIEVEAPVFGNVDAAPVRVGAAESLRAPVELEAPDAMEQLSGKIALLSHTVQSGVSYAELTLSPANLGKLTVSIAHSADGGLHVLLIPSTEKAAALLEKNLNSLQGLLAANGKTQATVELRGGEPAPQQFLNPDDQSGRQSQQQQQQQRRPRQDALRIADFMNQLRLGLVDLGAAV